MCNIAGYVGSRQAAPILVEMMKKQEGWDAGYYTGLATIDNGVLHMDKVVGDTAQLLKEFFEPATCVQEAALDYEILYRLQQQGRLKIRVSKQQHPVADLTAPKFYASLL